MRPGIGRAVVAAALARGVRVRAVSRTAGPAADLPAGAEPLAADLSTATAAAGATLVFADNLYMYGPQPGGRAMVETTPSAATDHKGRVRAAMAADLLDRCSRGDLRVTIGRLSDYYGPHGVTSALGATFFAAALRGRPVNVIGSSGAPHTMAYLPDIAAGLLALAEHEKLGPFGPYRSRWPRKNRTISRDASGPAGSV